MSLHEQIYEQLCRYLMQGEFSPGQKVSLRQLAETFGTSTAPIREAMQRLDVLGAVVIRPKKNILIPTLSADKYIDILEMRIFLEGRAVRKACEHITQKEIESIITIDTALRESIADGRLQDTMRENQRFLFAIYKSGRSEVLLEMIEHLWLLVGPTINKHLVAQFHQNPDTLQTVFANHTRIIEALKIRNPATAALAKQDDLLVGAELLIDVLRRNEAEQAAHIDGQPV